MVLDTYLQSQQYGLIAFAIYYLYHKENNNQENNVNVITEVQTNEITNVRFGISNLDKLNPIVSRNQNVQDIVAKIVYDSLLTVTEDYKLEYRTCNRMVKSRKQSIPYEIKRRCKVA